MPSEDINSYMEQMYLCNPLVQPLVQRVVRTTSFPWASCGLDAGCGVGLQIPLLAAAVGPQGRITGLDIAPEFLAEAKDNMKYKGLTDRVTFFQGDIYDPPFENEEFDWIWSANCACYAVRQPLKLLQGFRRTLKPGGLLLLLTWSSQQLLPGYPRLEALLNATTPGIAPFKKDAKPEYHCLRLLGWLRKAGFVEASVHPFSKGAHAPFDETIRNP